MPEIAVALLAAGLAWFGWQRWRLRHCASYIDAYPYARLLDRRLAARHPGLSEAQRAEVFAGLVDYFHICRQAGQRMVSMPSQVVDDAWHEFILFTRLYNQFCRGAFGRFLHHTPTEAMASRTMATEGIRRAWRLACAREKIDPKVPTRLPRLFALDAKLGIAGGFIYHLDCRAAHITGDSSGFCASDIGCGGSAGCGGESGSDAGSDGGGDSGGDGGGCGGGCGGGD